MKVIAGDFTQNGLTDLALVRQTPGWSTIPVAASNGDGNWTITNGAAPDFIPAWARPPASAPSPATTGNHTTNLHLQH